MKPTGVQLHRADGTVIDCELVHQGLNDEGMDCWLIANALYQPGDQITVVEMPAWTALGFAAPSRLTALDIEWTDPDGTAGRKTLEW